MNLKKAEEKIREIDWTQCDPKERPKLFEHALKRVLEALAEGDEGEEQSAVVWKICEACGYHTYYEFESNETISDKQLLCWKCGKVIKKPATPAYASGDLVENKDGKRAIFQRYLPTDRERCWVLAVCFEGDFISPCWNVEDLRLIQRGFCDVSLKRIRDRLTKG